MAGSDTFLYVRAKPDMKTFEMTDACQPIRKLKLFALFIPNLYGFFLFEVGKGPMVEKLWKLIRSLKKKSGSCCINIKNLYSCFTTCCFI